MYSSFYLVLSDWMTERKSLSKLLGANQLTIFSASTRSLENVLKVELEKTATHEPSDVPMNGDEVPPTSADETPIGEKDNAALSERRKALFEPLDPIGSGPIGRRIPAEDLLPPPDFESASYPKGWLVGKKRKLVNVDVVESMRRIAVQEMNRKV